MASSFSNWLTKELVSLNCEIKLNDLKGKNDTDCTQLKEFEHVASYNWSLSSIPSSRPIIVVPGHSSKLNESNLTRLNGRQLKKSEHKQMRDENRYYQHDYPLESLFTAVKICSPEFKFNQLDFVTDRNNLRKLLNFVENACKDSFRIDFQQCGKFVALIRNDEVCEDFCNDYGKDFEHVVTKPDSNSNQIGGYRRVVTYKLGDFRFLTRFEVDCCDESEKNLPENSIDSLTASMNRVDIKSEPKKLVEKSQLRFLKQGTFRKEEKMVELTTKSTFNGVYDFPVNKWNQLFFSNTDLLVIGWHSRGQVKKIEKLNFQEVTKRCSRTDTQSSLSKLNQLMKKLKEIALSKNVVFSAIFKAGSDSIKIYECSTEYSKCLPKEFYEQISSNN
jgi:hypothetical protein